MASIIDAFVITMGLDPKGVQSGSRAVRDELRQTSNAADRATKDMESAGKRAANYFASLKNEVVGLVLAFAGAKSLKDFVGGILQADASMGRLSQRIGVSVQQIGAWRAAIREVGGKPEDADSALAGISQAYQNYQLTGTTGHDADFMGLGVPLADLKDASKTMLDLAAARDKMSAAEYNARLNRLGFISPEMVNLLMRGRSELERSLPEWQRMADVTDADAQAAQDLQRKLGDLSTVLQGKARPYVSKFADVMLDLLNNTDAMNLAMPVMTGLLGALGAAALTAYWPFALLAGAIAAVVVAYRDWKHLQNMSPEERKRFDDRGVELRAKAWEQLKSGDIGGVFGTLWQGFSERLAGDSAPSPTAGASASGGNASGSYFHDRLRGAGFSEEQIRGIAAGIKAEGGTATAVNPTSGAFGIGQWLGGRKKELLRRYGPNPSLSQQIEFLIWELKGGDHGGRSVMGQSSAQGAMTAYLRDFMRPGNGLAGDMSRGLAALGIRGGMGGGGAVTQQISTGPITIYTPNGDPQTIARGLSGALAKRGLAVQSNSGLSG